MRLRLKLLAGLVGLSMVAYAPPSPRQQRVTSLSVSQPMEWTPLHVAVQAQSDWYRTVSQRETITSLRPPKRGSHRGYSSTAECIGAVENGGSYARGSNPSHTGRYQFSYSTWVANGGNPDTWENASPQEQDDVFARTVERNGYSDWVPYDGC